MDAIKDFLLFPLKILGIFARFIEEFLFLLIEWYDTYVYSPLQTWLMPIVSEIPRSVQVGGEDYTVFTANIVSWTRTVLVIPVAWCLKYDYNACAFLLILLHDFLDHVDGIVAKAQKIIYGQIDDPLLGGFMDAFCDKIVNVLSLWTILLVTDYSLMRSQEILLFFTSCSIIIAYEFILGVVRVQDYFRAFYNRLYQKDVGSTSTVNVAAVMEGKLKEKLESMGIAFLCLSQSNTNAVQSFSGIAGIVCLLLSVRLAHASLQHKLKARQDNASIKKNISNENQEGEKTDTEVQTESCVSSDNENKSSEAEDVKKEKESLNRSTSYILRRDSMDSDSDSKVPEKKYTVRRLQRRRSMLTKHLDTRVDRIYTIGCFDLFHHGHVRLLERMRSLGKEVSGNITEVIIGVHDSRSIFKLKRKVPIDSTEKRMQNVKQYADTVYCVAGTDPTTFISCMVNRNDDKINMYARGDDMENFPAREFCEQYMIIKFLPYSQGVSSTKLRKEHYNSSRYGPHTHDDDHAMFY